MSKSIMISGRERVEGTTAEVLGEHTAQHVFEFVRPQIPINGNPVKRRVASPDL